MEIDQKYFASFKCGVEKDGGIYLDQPYHE
jgi:hypothetical protein